MSLTTPKSPAAIPILFAADSRYVKYLWVAVYSLVKNKCTSTHYDLFFLTPRKYSKKILHAFSWLQQKYPTVDIHYVEMGTAFNNAADKNRILPSPSYYYLTIADIISNYDKALYLDPDIIVCKDLTDLFNIDLQGNYVAGVKAAGYMVHDEAQLHYYASIGLKDMSQYINASSLLWNLKLIREANITAKFRNLSNNIYHSMDQDILNLVCYGKILHIPLKYNLMVKYLPYQGNPKWPYKLLKDIYGEANLEEAQKDPVIIHYANVGEKPWQTRTQLDHIWWKYAKDSPFYCEFVFKYYVLGRCFPLCKKILKNIFTITNTFDKQNRKVKQMILLGHKWNLSK